MRLVMIEECDYERFESIRDKLMSTIPFALVGVCYSPKLKTAVFNFWDSDYIPAELKEFIYKPSRTMVKSVVDEKPDERQWRVAKNAAAALPL